MDVKSISWVFIKQLFILGVQVVVTALLFAALFVQGMNYGFIMPANYASNVLTVNESQLKVSGPVDTSLIPKYSKYALFDSEGKLEFTNMSDELFQIYNERINGNYGSKANLMHIVEREDGKKLVISYDIMPKFTNDKLNDIFPNIELLMLILGVVFFLILLFARARKVRKIVNREMAPLLADIEKINNRNLFELNSEENGSGVVELGKKRKDKSISNITEIANAQNVLKDMKDALAQSLKTQWENEQRRKENISALAHDIKTPLTVIRGNAELLCEDATDIKKNSANSSVYVDAISDVSDDMKELTTGIIRGCDRIQGYISLLMNQNQKPNISNVNVCEISKLINQQAEELCQAGRIPFKINNMINSERYYFEGDSERVQRAVMNLVRNAVEHTDPNKGIRILIDVLSKNLVFEINDFGKGFSQEAIIHCKEQFYSEKKERSGDHYGLGMYFASEVATQTGGSIEIENTSDGARVSFFINNLKEIEI